MDVLFGVLVTALVMLAVGGVVFWLLLRSKTPSLDQSAIEDTVKANLAAISQEALAAASEQMLKLAEERLGRETQAGAKDLESKKQLIDQQVGAVKEELGKVTKLVIDLGKDRERKFGEITTELKNVGVQTQMLSSTTASLRDVLRGPQSRGLWGERMAEDILRAIGFVEGVNYVKQKTLEGSGSRPDFSFMLPGNMTLNMDVKFPFDNYVRYVDATEETDRERYKSAFVKDVNVKVKGLATREYIDPEQGTLDYVLMFIPNESLYGFIHESDPTLLDTAMRERVVCCSPATLFAVLVVIRQAVDNFALQKASEDIISMFGRFYDEWAKFEDSMEKVGKRIASAQNAYEEMAGPRKRQLEKPLQRIENLRNQRELPIAELPGSPVALEAPGDPGLVGVNGDDDQ